MEVGLVVDGCLDGWYYRVVIFIVIGFFNLCCWDVVWFKDVILMCGVESKFYGIKDFWVDYIVIECQVWLVLYCGIGVIYISFVVEVFMDELVE